MNYFELVIGHWYYDVDVKDRVKFVRRLLYEKYWFDFVCEDGFGFSYFIDDVSSLRPAPAPIDFGEQE